MAASGPESSSSTWTIAWQIPAIAEPWFLPLNAAIEVTPVMVSEELQKAGPAIERAEKTYG
jgi:hypothetical protein